VASPSIAGQGGPWRGTPEPGRVCTELMVATPALEQEPKQVAGWLAEVVLG
jgi:hypothetical protein